MRAVSIAALIWSLALVPPAGADDKVSPSRPAAGNAEAGAVIYQRCLACHSLERNRTGPRHCGLIGRRAGSVRDFQYSDAMRNSGIVWNRKTLDRFLTTPTRVVPGTYMTYAGVDDAGERRDLIAYLERATRDEKICGGLTP